MIYFIEATATKAVKIGFTSGDPKSRLAALQTGSCEPLSLLGAIPGGMDKERKLHEEFARHRIGGEWFAGHPDVVATVRRLIRPSVRDLAMDRGASVWLIAGEAANDSGGGDTRILCIWPADKLLPDPDRALGAVSRRLSWYRISSVEDVTDKPAVWPVPVDSVKAALSAFCGVVGLACDPDVFPIRFSPFGCVPHPVTDKAEADRSRTADIFVASARDSYGPDVIACPCCGFDYQRPEGNGSNEGVAFSGECGSRWEIRFEFHEGVTSSRLVITRDCRDHINPNEDF